MLAAGVSDSAEESDAAAVDDLDQVYEDVSQVKGTNVERYALDAMFKA